MAEPDADELDWDLEERDQFMEEHEGADDEPASDVLVRSDE
jgi:hypothetical protein